MRRRVAIALTGSGLALAVAVLAPGSRRASDRAAPGPSARAAAPAAPAPPRPAGAPAGILGTADAPRRAAADPGARARPAAGSPIARALAAYTADELALVADFEALTGREAPPELLVLVERRRGGATAGELAATAARLFAGDPLGRAAALRGLRAHGPAPAGP